MNVTRNKLLFKEGLSAIFRFIEKSFQQNVKIALLIKLLRVSFNDNDIIH